MILVTGGTGYVGQAVVAALLAAGKPVRAVVRDPSAPAASRLRERGVELLRGEVGDESSLVRAAQGVEAVVHLVAVIRERKSATFATINYRGTVHALDAARRAGVRRFVHFSALGADPASPYSYLRSKGLAEEAVRQSGLDFTIFRPSVVFGPGDEFTRALAALIIALPVVPIVGNGESLFQPVWIGDVAAATVRSLDDPVSAHRAFDLGGPQQVTYRELVNLIAATLNRSRPELDVPLAVLRPLAGLMTWILPTPPVTPGMLSLLAVPNETNHSATEALAGHPPRPLAGNLDYVRDLSLGQAWKAILGFGLPEDGNEGR